MHHCLCYDRLPYDAKDPQTMPLLFIRGVVDLLIYYYYNCPQRVAIVDFAPRNEELNRLKFSRCTPSRVDSALSGDLSSLFFFFPALETPLGFTL